MEHFSNLLHLPRMKNALNKLVDRQSRPERVGPRVTAIRCALDKPKKEFALLIGVDPSSLTKIEKGTAGLDIAVGERVAALYGVGLDFIYRGDLSDLPASLREKILQNLQNPPTN